MIEWIPCELHTHTVNSDGKMTLRRLALEAKKAGIKCIALTDHNTISGHSEISSVMQETGIHIIPGMEWTTFYGHMLAMGITQYVDWRNRGKSDIHRGMKDIHAVGGLTGIAHPYRIGSPMATGCHWEFEVKDWNDVDYIEVWSETFPSINPVNKRAYELWTSLLNRGYRLTGVSGRDWHEIDNSDTPIAVTYLGINENRKLEYGEAILNALLYGRAVSTMGPLMYISVQEQSSERRYMVGEEIKTGKKNNQVLFNIIIDYKQRKEKWKLDSNILNIVLTSNKGKLKEIEIKIAELKEIENVVCTLKTEELIWVRAELYGIISANDTMIAFTNPIYFAANDL